MVEGCEEALVGDACFEGVVEGSAQSSTRAAFVGKSREVGVVAGGVGVDGHKEDISAFIEDLLCSVSMMEVDIEDGDAWWVGGWLVLAQEVFGGDRSVVEKAVAAAHVAACVVPWRAAECVGKALPFQEVCGTSERDIGGGAGGAVGASNDRCAEVKCVVARCGEGVFGGTSHPAHGEGSGEDGRRCATCSDPTFVGMCEVGEVGFLVNCAERGITKGSWG